MKGMVRILMDFAIFFYLTNFVRRINLLNLSMFVYVLVRFAFRNEIIPECHGNNIKCVHT